MPPKASEERTPASTAAFTLIELVLAVAILGGSFLTLLLVRAQAVNRAGTYNQERRIQRLAQEKLDQVMYGLEEELEGTFENEQQKTWHVQVQNLGDPDTPLFACTITVTYPDAADRESEQTYELTSWIFYPSQESILHASIEQLDTEGRGF